MNPDVKSRWLEALRSGDFVQAHRCLGRLEPDGPRHCCLGVLLEVLREMPEVGIEVKRDQIKHNYDYTGSDGASGYTVCSKAGVNNNVAHLIKLNDVENAPFSVIADWIEANL